MEPRWWGLHFFGGFGTTTRGVRSSLRTYGTTTCGNMRCSVVIEGVWNHHKPKYEMFSRH